MGKRKSKKSIPIETIYIAPPTNAKTEEIEYDPKTKVTDAFEDDLEFLLQTTAHTTVERSLSSKPNGTYTSLPTGKEKQDSVNEGVLSEQSSKLTKKTKKQILDFDITFSSDEDAEYEDTELSPAFSQVNENRGGKTEKSADYLSKELGLDSDTDGFSSTDESEDFELVNELYEKLIIDDFGDAIVGNVSDGDDDEEGDQNQDKQKRRRKPKSKKSKAINDDKTKEIPQNTGATKKKNNPRNSRKPEKEGEYDNEFLKKILEDSKREFFRLESLKMKKNKESKSTKSNNFEYRDEKPDNGVLKEISKGTENAHVNQESTDGKGEEKKHSKPKKSRNRNGKPDLKISSKEPQERAKATKQNSERVDGNDSHKPNGARFRDSNSPKPHTDNFTKTQGLETKDKAKQPKWAADAAKNGSLKKKEQDDQKKKEIKRQKDKERKQAKKALKKEETSQGSDGESPILTRSQLINRQSASKKEDTPKLGEYTTKSAKNSRNKTKKDTPSGQSIKVDTPQNE